MAWKKINAGEGRNRFERKRRTSFAVRRNRGGAKNCQAVFPAGTFPVGRADIYSDGNGRIAFAPTENGQFNAKKNGTTTTVSIPQMYAEKLPYGTTDVHMTPDGDMWVLDLNSISRPSLAAE